MSIRVAPLVVSEAERVVLEGWVRSSTGRAGLARRARIVLLAAEDRSHTEIAEVVGVSRPTVLAWRSRFEEGGSAALDDLHRSGRPRTVSHNDMGVALLEGPQAALGMARWR